MMSSGLTGDIWLRYKVFTITIVLLVKEEKKKVQKTYLSSHKNTSVALGENKSSLSF